MTDKVLPPGNYVVRVLVVGRDCPVDGGLLLQRWVTPARPDVMARFALQGVDVLKPKHTGRLPANSWVMIGVEHKPGAADAFAAFGSLQLLADTDSLELEALLMREVPRYVEQIATQFLDRIGVPFAAYVMNEERPEHVS